MLSSTNDGNSRSAVFSSTETEDEPQDDDVISIMDEEEEISLSKSELAEPIPIEQSNEVAGIQLSSKASKSYTDVSEDSFSSDDELPLINLINKNQSKNDTIVFSDPDESYFLGF